MNLLCSDLLRLFIHHGNASTTYAFSSSTRKHSHLLTTHRYIEESKRRLTTIERNSDNSYDVECISWIPLLPNGEVEGIKHSVEKFPAGDMEYVISSCRNNKKHGLWIGYYSHYACAVVYANDVKNGFEQWSRYDGGTIIKYIWVNGHCDEMD